MLTVEKYLQDTFSVLQTCGYFLNAISCPNIICWNETDPDLLCATALQAKPFFEGWYAI